MSWAGIATNQCVSLNNLQDAVTTGVFVLKNTIPAGTKQITKSEANNYVNLNSSYAPFAAKSFNQLVVKSNLQPCVNLPYSFTLYYNYSDGDYFFAGFTTPSAACSSTTAITVYSSSSTITVGTQLYIDSCGSIQLYASSYDGGYPYFKIGSSYVTFENWDATLTGYVVRTIDDCGGGLATINISTNASLDILLYQSSMTVNGVAVVNVSGVDPNSPGNGGSVQTNQIGFYDITVNYYCTVSGQSIQLIDSSGAYQCNNTNTGFNSMTFFGVTINTSVDLTMTCVDGICYY